MAGILGSDYVIMAATCSCRVESKRDTCFYRIGYFGDFFINISTNRGMKAKRTFCSRYDGV